MNPGDFAAFAAVAVAAISALSIVSAITRRIGGGRHRTIRDMIGTPATGETQQTVLELRDEVESLRGEIASMRSRLGELDDLHNRVDFAERMLAQQKAREALPGPR